jgi:Acyltransferase
MNYLWSATDLALRALESLIASRIHVSGLDRLGGGPTLFIANHFTRFETFLVPYVHHKHTGRGVRCLADKKLFHGPLGAYLRKMQAWPTDDPDYKQQLVKDLATGACDWVIYPEGAMVKTKDVAQGGRLFLRTPFHNGAPRTGAAVFGLKAEALRWLGRQALESGDAAAQQELALLLGVNDLSTLAEQGVRLHPARGEPG